jgi:hypothetical protein
MSTISNLKRHALAQIGFLLLLSACGGGGSPSATGSQLAGSVIDGYIEGAKVCLDVNSNGACDTGEPTATTNAAGGYKLDVSSGTNITGLSVIAEIPDTAKDSDDGGKTLAQAGKFAYTMATIAEQPSVITPLTTLIVGRVKTDNINLAQATSKILEQLGLPGSTNPHEDHIAKENTLVHQAAKQVAGQLQQAQRAVGVGVSAGERWNKILQAREAAEKEAGLITKTGSLNMPAQLTQLATGQVIAYSMTGARGQPIKATAMLFTPQAKQPTAGWPLIVFGHGTVGVGSQCAPSVTVNATSSWDYAPLVAILVSSGFAVVAPDYEGLGSSEMGVVPGHPYLDLRSAGQSMALAAVAAKKKLATQLSGAWATLGHSQGGHAALAGAQFSGMAAQLDPALNYRGAVAIAPASQLLSSVNAISQFVADSSTTYNQALNASASSNLYGAYLIKGSQSTASPISPEAVLGEKMLSIYKTVETTCLNDFSASIGSDIHQYAMGVVAAVINYAGLKISAVNEPKVAAILAGNDPGQVKLPGSNLIVQGSADTTVLPVITQSLVDKMKAKGSTVTLSLHSSIAATHSGVLGLQDAQNAIAAHLTQIFSSGGSGGGNPSPVVNRW